MHNVKITVFGKTAIVDAANVDSFQERDELIQRAQQLQRGLDNGAVGTAGLYIRSELQNTMIQIKALTDKMSRKGMVCEFID